MGRNGIIHDDQIETTAGNARFKRCRVTASTLARLKIDCLPSITVRAGLWENLSIEVGLHQAQRLEAEIAGKRLKLSL